MTTGSGSVTPLKAALGCTCPRCGQGRLYKGFLAVADRCEVCGLELAKNDSGDGPAVFLIFILGFLAVPLALWIEAVFTVPIWLPALVGGLFTIGLALVLLRPSKALVMALQYKHRREDYERG